MKDLALFGFLAPFVLLFNQVRGFFMSILKFFWKSQTILPNISVPFYKRLNEQCRRIELANWTIGSQWAFLKKEGKEGYFLYKQYAYEIYLYKYIFPILITSGQSRETFNIHYFNFTFPLEKWINDTFKSSVERWESSNFWICLKQGRSSKRRESSDSGPRSDSSSPSKDIASSQNTGEILSPWYLTPNKLSRLFYYTHDDLSAKGERSLKDKFIFTKQTLEVKQIAQKWLKAREFYESKNILHKYSILMYGPPGTGKSSSIREICRDLDIPIYIFDISTMDNQEFDKALNELPSCSAVILFEDLETQFNGRENTNKTQASPGLTFDFFINALSGVNNYNKNKIIFATTNHINKLDPALLRRFDKKVEMQNMTFQEKEQYLQKMTEDTSLIKLLLQEGQEDSNAEFEQRTIEKILTGYWQN